MERLQLLFQKYLDNHISADEFTEMWQLLAAEEQSGTLTPQLQQLWEQKSAYSLPDNRWDKQFKVLKEVQEPVSIKRNSWWKYAAAAVIITMLCASYFIFFKNGKPDSEKSIATNNTLPNDIKPGSNGAILSFDNGRTIILDTAKDGQLAANVTKKDASITVQGTSVEYATLTTPRARQQQLILADGSKVWLNAASSIRFPSAFTGNQRVVEVTGEAYFEVAKDASKPFIVKVNDAAIEVLGTHFNVMAYTNESSLQTTLLEGSVKFKQGNKTLLLKPGQQIQLMSGGEIKLVANADVELVTAWKNGMQSFNNADIQTIMRQVERWYDVDVSYQGIISKRSFNGDIPRTANLSELLKLLEVNKIHFTIDVERKKLIVMP